MSSYNLPFKPGDEVVELGGGDNPIIKRITQLKCTNVDVRQVEGVDIVRDLEGDFSDIGPFDGLFAQYVAEHISWPKVTAFFGNCFKILKPGGIALFVVPDTYGQMTKILQKSPEEITLEDSNFLFGGQDFSDNTHKWLLSKPLVTKLLKEAGFSEVKITDHSNPEARDMFVEAHKQGNKPSILVGAIADANIKLNLGSFTVTWDGWTHCDIRSDIKQHVEEKGHVFEFCDVTKPFRWTDNTVSLITAHHLIEHLSREEGAYMLGECFRVLKRGGVIRLSTPDIDTFINHHRVNDFKTTYGEEFEVKNAEDGVDAFFRLAFMGHKTIYNYPSLRRKMEKAGFSEVKLMPYGASRSTEIMTETTDSFPDHSFYIEAIKPQSSSQTAKPVITVEEELEPYQKYLRGEEASNGDAEFREGSEEGKPLDITPPDKAPPFPNSVYEYFQKHYLSSHVDADVEYFSKFFDEPLTAKIIEIGANQEPVSNILSLAGYDVTGIDLNDYNEEKRENLPRNFNFIKGDFNKLTFDDKFDVIVSTSTLEHVGLGVYGETPYPDEDGDIMMMRRSWDILKEGGRIYLTVPVGVYEVDWRGWRVYDKKALEERLIQNFTVLKQAFFVSGQVPGHEIGDEMDEDFAFNLHGPEGTVLLILEKRSKSEKVSIVVPTVNATTFEECINRIHSKTHVDYELTIICDAPTPEKRSLLAQMQEHEKTTVIINEERTGVPRAMNQGIRQSTGDYVMLMNDDVLVETDGWMAPLVSALKAHPEFGFVGPTVELNGKKEEGVFGALGECSLLSRELIDKVGQFDESEVFSRLCCDGDYYVRCIRAGYTPHGVPSVNVTHLVGQTVKSELTQRDLVDTMRELISRYGDEVLVDQHRFPAYRGE